MPSPRKRRLLLGLFAGALPVVLQPISAALLLGWLGGLDGLSRTLGMAGRPIHLMAVLSVVSTVLLALVLFFRGWGRKVPGVVPVVLATVPWLVGATGALRGARAVLEAIASVSSQDDRVLLLMRGTGELICARLLGAWVSATLLVATVGALIIAGAKRSGEEPAGVRGTEAGLEAGAVLMLALVGGVTAIGSKGLSDVLIAASSAAPADRVTLLVAGRHELWIPLMLRTMALVALGAVVIGWVRLGLMRRPRDSAALVSLVPLVIVVASVLWVDGRPLARMREVVGSAAPEATRELLLPLLHSTVLSP